MRSSIVLAFTAAFALVGAGCMEDEPAPNFPDEPEEALEDMALHAEHGTTVTARVEGSDITGPDVKLGRYREPEGGAMRGVAFGKPVSLTVDPGRVTGIVGMTPLDVAVAREGRTLRLTGLVRGVLSDFRIDPLAARGNLGRCAYELVRDGTGYAGRRSCGAGTERVRLRVPDALASWQDSERAAALAVVFGG
jgi:hypothetical protein